MAARVGMEDLIVELRGMTRAGTADYSVVGTGGTVFYWSDDELQRALDRHRTDIFREELYIIETYASGNVLDYKHYRSHYGNYEGGTASFFLEDATGADIAGTLYTADYMLGTFDFLADQGGSARYLTGRSYNLNAAAADVWRTKLGFVSGGVRRWKTDGHEVDRSTSMQEASEMVRYYESLGGSETVEVTA